MNIYKADNNVFIEKSRMFGCNIKKQLKKSWIKGNAEPFCF